MISEIRHCKNCLHYSLGWCFLHSRSVEPESSCESFYHPRVLKEEEAAKNGS